MLLFYSLWPQATPTTPQHTMAVPEELVFEGNYTLRTNEVNRLHRAMPTALIHLLQEAALENVLDLKVSAWDLKKEQISWVLMRKHLEIHRFPTFGETITIRTHPAGFERVFTYRDYQVWGEDNQLIASSSTTWLLMHTERRRIARIPAFVIEKGTFDNSTCLPHALASLPDVTDPDIEQVFRVNWHDMDFNEHLSNIRYMQWLFETVPGYPTLELELSTIDIIYKAECRWKDKVHVATQTVSEGHYLHLLTRQSDGEEIARAQTQWRPVV